MYDNNIIMSVVREIQRISGKPPGKKALQKLVYLIEEAGDDLGFAYSIHFYGPYSADLDYAVKYLDIYGDLKIKITPTEHQICVAGDTFDAPPLSGTAQRIIKSFGHKSPSELELLATALYVQRAISAADESKIISGVQKIKGTKYSQDNTRDAITALKDANFF
jgi:uncharacterized protein YwgA